jgi:DM4/DM12 family
VKYVGKQFFILINYLNIKCSYFLAGYLGPIDTPKFINCNAIRNFQYQYDLPANLSQVYTFYANWTRPKARSLDRDDSEELMWKPDASRQIAYDLMEQVLTNEGKNGHQCLMRTICEVAETPLKHNGLVGELLEIFFTPGEHENIHEDYRDARKAGLNHIDCERMYPDCPFGHGILDTFSVVKDYNFMDIFYNW